jgi:hypothetical protein
LTGEFGAPGERAGELLAWRRAGVFDQGTGSAEPGGVAGLGQDRRGADRGEAGDGGDQLGQLQLIEDADRPGFGVGQLVFCVLPVPQKELDSLQCAAAMGEYPVWSVNAANRCRTILSDGFCPPWRVMSRRTACSNRARPSR